MIRWVSVPGFVGYELSTAGQLMHRGEGEVRPSTYANGDLKFEIDQYTTRYSGPCWRLMLMSFYIGYNFGMEPIFQDGNRQNHALDNLEFVEAVGQNGDYREVRWREHGPYRKVDRRFGQRIRVNETGEVYDSLDEVAAAIGGQKQNVSAVLNGRLKKHCGCTFSYV